MAPISKLAYLDQCIYGNIQRGACKQQLRDALSLVGAEPAASVKLLFEAARVPDRTIREARVELIREMATAYIEPPTYLESRELLAEIRRQRRPWTRPRTADPLVRKLLQGWRTWFQGAGAPHAKHRSFLNDLSQDEIGRNHAMHRSGRENSGTERRLEGECPPEVVGYRLPEPTTWKEVASMRAYSMK
jgi:hypothetical protein